MNRQSLDNYITGRYGEDQFTDTPEYSEGIEARRAGKSMEDCPYPAGQARAEWLFGWMDGG